MFRLTAFLCLAIYGVMLIGGQDRGQLRFGLMQAEQAVVAQAVAPSAPVEPVEVPQVVAAAYSPDKPLMAAPAAAVDASAPEATVPAGRILYVAAASANVREGPGKDHAVLERLPQGEAVLVLAEGEGADGWSLIRIEGDGVEGYVASRLLRE